MNPIQTIRDAAWVISEHNRLHFGDDHNTVAEANKIIAALAELEKQEPMFWVRLRSDGLYEGPIHNAQIERVRAQSGAWSPLFLGAAPVAQQPQAKATWLTDPRQTKERQFAEFLNDRRNMNVSAVFHDLMGKFAALSAPQQAEAAPGDVARDAERYRQVRRGQKWSVINGIGDELKGEALDAAIDAAPAAAPKGQP